MTASTLARVDLPPAPPVARAIAPPLLRRRPPAVALVVLGIVLVLGPIVGGLFSKVAAGEQLLDEFAPHLEVDALARYDDDLALLRAGAAGLDGIYAAGTVTDGQFAGIDQYRRDAAAIDARASNLLAQVRAAEPDYRRVAGIGGFERVPFLVVLAGVVAIYGGCLLLGAGRGRAQAGAAIVVLVGVALLAYPFLSDLPNGTRAGSRMLDALEPIMSADEVRQLQLDFVVLVQAVGELDTSFPDLAPTGPPAAAVDALVAAWPTVSSDFAELVGTINDNLDNYDALEDLDGLTSSLGVAGLPALPWLLVGIGATTTALATAAWPHRRKETA